MAMLRQFAAGGVVVYVNGDTVTYMTQAGRDGEKTTIHFVSVSRDLERHDAFTVDERIEAVAAKFGGS